MMSPEREAAMGYAAEVTRMLWPEPWGAPQLTRRRHRPAPTHRNAYVFPGTRRPRLLLPADVPESSAMLQRLGKGRSRSARLARRVLVRSVRSPRFSLLRWPMVRVEVADSVHAESIESYLAAHLGADVRVGVLLGTARANQKPVLAIFALDGGLIGYAKIGHNALTAALVRHEAQTLALLGRHPATAFRAPELLHAGQWRGLEVLAMSALSGTPGRDVPESQRVAAMRELAQMGGTVGHRLAESGFLRRLEAQIEQILDDAVRERLSGCLIRIANLWGETEIQLGGWHGDWGHWNMALSGDLVQVWDWERYDPQVPMGFDGLHHRAQRVRPANRDFTEQERLLLQSAPGILARFGVPADRSDLTVVLYLLEISVRYALALNHAVVRALRCRSSWALGLLEQEIARQPALDHLPGGRA